MEIELKLLVAPQDVLAPARPSAAGAICTACARHADCAKRAPGEPQVLDMHDIYVDTPDLQLCRHQAGLRVRYVDGHWVQT